MLSGLQMWDCVGKGLSKTCINGEQVGPVDFVIDKFVLVGTRGKSGAYSKPLCAAEHQYSTQVYSSMCSFNASFVFNKSNYVYLKLIYSRGLLSF